MKRVKEGGAISNWLIQSSMRTAVCMYGFLRTYDTTANSLIMHILQKNNADLFIFCPRSIGASVIPQGIDITTYKLQNSKKIEEEDISGVNITEQQLRALYGNHVKGCRIYDYNQKQFEDLAETIEGYCVIPTYRVCSLLYNVSGSIQLMLDYANEQHIEYDCVILLRPDLAFYSDLDVQKLDLQSVWVPIGGGMIDKGLAEPPQYFVEYYKNVHDGELIRYNSIKFTDQFIVTSFENMKILASVYNSIPEYGKKKFPIHAESILYYELCKKQNLKVQYFQDFYYEIFRNNYLTIENHMLINTMFFDQPMSTQARDYELDQSVIRQFINWRKVDYKNRIKNIIKMCLLPIKKIVLTIKHFLMWLCRG